MIPAEAWPAGDITEWHDDETRTFHDFFNETTRPYTPVENAEATARSNAQVERANRQVVMSQVHAALAANREYLALKLPTGAQSTAQTRALTRQMNAVIRLLVNDLNGTD